MCRRLFKKNQILDLKMSFESKTKCKYVHATLYFFALAKLKKKSLYTFGKFPTRLFCEIYFGDIIWHLIANCANIFCSKYLIKLDLNNMLVFAQRYQMVSVRNSEKMKQKISFNTKICSKFYRLRKPCAVNISGWLSELVLYKFE